MPVDLSKVSPPPGYAGAARDAENGAATPLSPAILAGLSIKGECDVRKNLDLPQDAKQAKTGKPSTIGGMMKSLSGSFVGTPKATSEMFSSRRTPSGAPNPTTPPFRGDTSTSTTPNSDVGKMWDVEVDVETALKRSSTDGALSAASAAPTPTQGASTGTVNYYEIAMKRAQEEENTPAVRRSTSTSNSNSMPGNGAHADAGTPKVNYYEIAMQRAATEDKVQGSSPAAAGARAAKKGTEGGSGKINYYEIAMKRAQEEERGTPAKAEASTPAAGSAQARADNASGKVNYYEIAMKRAAQEERASLDRPSQEGLSRAAAKAQASAGSA
eukprot:Tamp_19072.p1 GENE.Tamp_19072~~Tamp_19072.p1  ORF type:complete len:328 (+),score=76.74 Tamp_19072:283-1266(+)